MDRIQSLLVSLGAACAIALPSISWSRISASSQMNQIHATPIALNGGTGGLIPIDGAPGDRQGVGGGSPLR